MYKIAVFSDSHGNLNALKAAIERAQLEFGPLDYIVHCGDHFEDLKSCHVALECPIYGVLGNIDPVRNAPLETVFMVGEKTVYVTHGHLYDVKFNYQRLFYKGLEKGADLVLFGHTHTPFCHTHEGLTLFNPGSVGRPNHGQKATFGLVEIERNILNCRTITL